MPSTQARRFDQRKLRKALVRQWEALQERTEALTDEELKAPSRLPAWSVGDLVTHIARGPLALGAYLDAPEPPGPNADVDLTAWAGGLAKGAEAIRDRAYADAGLRLADTVPAARAALDAAPPERLVAARAGSMTLTDALATRLIEAVVHADDLDHGFPHDREALAVVVRALADIMAARAPGGSVELRVPPFAVVQCVAGPRHTRGTPPNVVETDPLTWLRLAGGRLAWAACVADGRVRASGERSNLAAYLPLLG